MCSVLEVSRSGYYAWKSRGQSNHSQKDTALLSKIRYIYDKHRKVYGAPRIHEALKSEGWHLGRKRVARLMRKNGIVAEPHRRMRWKRVFKTAVAADNLVWE